MPDQPHVTVIDRPPPRLARLLRTTPKLGHEHHWEGELDGLAGAAKSCLLKLKATIAFHGAMMDGGGRFTNFPAVEAPADADFAITGTLNGTGATDLVAFEIWSASAVLGRVPFAASGTLGCDGREMTGDWSIDCFNPGTCDCGGGSGAFRFRRID